MRIGIFGGSFDPVHTGHLILAEQLREAAGLSKVIFVPAHTSPFKLDSLPASGEHRVEMLKKALAKSPYFEVSDIEIRRPSPSYTIDTLEYFQKEMPESEISFILGSDAFLGIERWHKAEELLSRFSFIIGCRKGFLTEKAKEKMAKLKESYGLKAEFYDIPELEISSSLIRSRIAEKRSAKFLLPEEVLSYIKEHGLYEDTLKKAEEYAKKREKPLRFEHTKGVVSEITKLSKRYGVDSYKAQIAAWLHDTYKPAGNLEHGRLAAEAMKRDLGITDPEIAEAVEFHTTGRPGMCDLAKLLKLADMTEPTRTYPGVERIRAGLTDSLDESLLMLMKETRNYVLSKGGKYEKISDDTIAELERKIGGEKKG